MLVRDLLVVTGAVLVLLSVPVGVGVGLWLLARGLVAILGGL